MLDKLFWKYIAGPILADAKNLDQIVISGYVAETGYNLVNTSLWALIGLLAVFAISKYASGKGYDLRPRSVVYIVPYIILGGALRFAEDTGDLPLFLSVILVTPIIYLVVSAITVLSGILSIKVTEDDREAKSMFLMLGATYSLVVLAISSVLGYQGTISWEVLIVSSCLTVVAYLTYDVYASNTVYSNKTYSIIFGSQIFGGSSSMMSIYEAGYTAKQILTQNFISTFGPPGALILKTIIALGGIYTLQKMDSETNIKTLLTYVLVITGLGTGTRVFLRAITGI